MAEHHRDHEPEEQGMQRGVDADPELGVMKAPSASRTRSGSTSTRSSWARLTGSSLMATGSRPHLGQAQLGTNERAQADGADGCSQLGQRSAHEPEMHAADHVGPFFGQVPERARMQLDRATAVRQPGREADVGQYLDEPIDCLRLAYARQRPASAGQHATPARACLGDTRPRVRRPSDLRCEDAGQDPIRVLVARPRAAGDDALVQQPRAARSTVRRAHHLDEPGVHEPVEVLTRGVRVQADGRSECVDVLRLVGCAEHREQPGPTRLAQQSVTLLGGGAWRRWPSSWHGVIITAYTVVSQ